MDTVLIWQLLDRWIVIGLFVLTFLYAIYKGIPAAMAFARETLDAVNVEHTHQINILTDSFSKSLGENRDKFLEQLEHQHNEQKKHHEEHGRILETVSKKIESCELFLKSSKNGRIK